MVKQKIKRNKRYKPKTIDTNHLRTIYKYEKALPNFDRNLTFKLYDIIWFIKAQTWCHRHSKKPERPVTWFCICIVEELLVQ